MHVPYYSYHNHPFFYSIISKIRTKVKIIDTIREREKKGKRGGKEREKRRKRKGKERR
jgi:hypothetical protein